MILVRALKEISVLNNAILHYAWGSKTFLPSFLNLPRPWLKPAAELWLGAHPKAPSQVRVGGRWQSLRDVIRADPLSVLGTRVSERFRSQMPFLLKILAIERPLSVQAHPDKKQAEEGFERENASNVPLDAPHRSYKDDNHKPELLCAIDRFEALKGFRTPEKILGLMDKVFESFTLGELDRLRREPNAHGLKGFFSSLMTMRPDRKARVVAEAVKGAERVLQRDRAFYWLLELNREYPGDMGVLSPLFLNLIELSQGEAIYVPAGELHNYLSGAAIEIMASSDNVLRGGLTPKHVDPNELLNIVCFDGSQVRKQKPSCDDPVEHIYQTPADAFQLSEIHVTTQERFISQTERSVEILLCMDGEGVIEDLKSGHTLPLKRGDSVIVPSVTHQYAVSGSLKLYRGAVGNLPNKEGPS